jgi:phosphate transport system substrate-binding protein
MTRIWNTLGAVLLVPAMLHSPFAVAQATQQPANYVAHEVTVSDDATYLTRDGAVQIVGNDGWDAMIAQFNELFLKTHPNFKRKFHPVLKGSSVAIPGLESGVSAFAPMGRAMWEVDRASFRRFYGYDPIDIRIGYDTFGPRAGRKSPPELYVNAKNPLAGLTVEQVERFLTEGNRNGDISRWGQLGLTGKWANRVIHVYGLEPESGGTASFRAEFLGGNPFTRRYESFAKPADVLRALAEDPYAVALLGFADAASVSDAVRPLPVAGNPGEPFVLPEYDVVRSGRYPFPAYLHIYINREPGKPTDPFVKEYVRMVLSREGQAIIADQKDTEEGYVPLAPSIIEGELKKLD